MTANTQRAKGSAAKPSDFLLEFVAPGQDDADAATSLDGIKHALTQMAGVVNQAQAEGTAVERGVAASAAAAAAQKKTRAPRRRAS